MASAPSTPKMDNPTLATLLRECATYVEQNKSSPILYKALEALHHYTETTQQSPSSAPQIPQKPAFQRPTNPNSNLIANGWMEQLRRSKMRIVWKQVLVSLVEGRRVGEETTLWVQRQVPLNSNGSNPKWKLEALHQIPMKWLQKVNFVDYYGDFRLSLKVLNVQEEFVFRLPVEEAVREWMATLHSAKEASETGEAFQHTTGGDFPDLLSSENNGGGESNANNQNDQDLFPDLLNDPPSTDATGTSSSNPTSQGTTPTSTQPQQQQSPKRQEERKTIKELRAIAHGAGYTNTRGMERADLEKIAKQYAPVSSKIPPPKYNPSKTPPSGNGGDPSGGGHAGTDSAKTKAESKASREERDRQQKEYIQLKRAQEVKRKEQEVREKIQREAEAARNARQQAAAGQQQPQHPHPSQRPAPWNTTGGSGSNGIPSPGRGGATRRPFNATQFESNRFFGNGTSHSKPHPATNQQQPQQSSSSYSTRPQQPPPQQQQQQQQPKPTPSAPPPPQQQHHPSPPRPQTGDPTSPISHKYAKAMKSDNDEQAAQTTIKRNILLTWALVPPAYNMLKPIQDLLPTIQIAFPPAFGVSTHVYFDKWKPIDSSDLILNASTMGNAPDENKLKKAVRKLRVFLHPDKLPRDLNAQQSFVCKMLWDVTNDAWEEFLKQKEQLDWVHN